MTNQELEEVQKTYHTDLSNIHELTVSVQENQLQGSSSARSLDLLTEGTDGASLTYKLDLITPDCEVFQVLPFKITYKK